MALYPGSAHEIPLTVTLYEQRVDPGTLQITVTDAAEAEVVYVYGTDAELVREDTGLYSLQLPIPSGDASVGTWSFRWDIGGDFEQTVTGSFDVYDTPDTVVITVEKQVADTPVPLAAVTVFSESGQLVGFGTTDLLGQVVFSLSDGVYTLHVQRAGWRFPSESLLTVEGASTLTIQGIDLEIVQAPTVGLCRLYGYVVGSDGAPLTAKILISPHGRRHRALVGVGAKGVEPANVGVPRDVRMAVSRSSDGFWEAELVQGAAVHVRIPALGWAASFRVPAQASVNFADVRPTPGAAARGE